MDEESAAIESYFAGNPALMPLFEAFQAFLG